MKNFSQQFDELVQLTTSYLRQEQEDGLLYLYSKQESVLVKPHKTLPKVKNTPALNDASKTPEYERVKPETQVIKDKPQLQQFQLELPTESDRADFQDLKETLAGIVIRKKTAAIVLLLFEKDSSEFFDKVVQAISKSITPAELVHYSENILEQLCRELNLRLLIIPHSQLALLNINQNNKLHELIQWQGLAVLPIADHLAYQQDIALKQDLWATLKKVGPQVLQK